jgi:hypothetical protein
MKKRLFHSLGVLRGERDFVRFCIILTWREINTTDNIENNGFWVRGL